MSLSSLKSSAIGNEVNQCRKTKEISCILIRLSQSRSHGFLVWCGRTRLSLARSRYALKSSTCERVYILIS